LFRAFYLSRKEGPTIVFAREKAVGFGRKYQRKLLISTFLQYFPENFGKET